MILRKVILFFTSILVALTAGRAFWVWPGENPANLSGATYVEFFQVLDRGIAIPIAVTALAELCWRAFPQFFSGVSVWRFICCSAHSPCVYLRLWSRTLVAN